MDKFIYRNKTNGLKVIGELLRADISLNEKEMELLLEYRKYLFDNPCHDELQSKATAVGIELAVRTLGLEIKGINK